MAHLSPSAIFSPTLARQQLATAKDWNYIDSWLSRQYSNKPPPPFERNPETLKALLALASLNEAADEEHDLISRIEAKALHELRVLEEGDSHKELLERLEDGLSKDGKAGLEALAGLSVAMNQHVPDVKRIGVRMVDLQVEMDDLEQASERVSVLEAYLKTELDQINALTKELRSEAYQVPTDLNKQTMDYQRKSKALAERLPELRDRVASRSSSLKMRITIEDVKEEEDKFRVSVAAVKDLETQVNCFNGLPQDTDLARLELERLRIELRDLIQQRDRMFEGLVERESPKKRRP